MRTNSKKDRKPQSIIEEQFKRIPVKKLSKQSGFSKRKARKIQAKKLIIALLLSLWSSKRNTYSDWASKLGQLIGDTVSKQAVAKRITEEFVIFLESVLKALIRNSVTQEKKEKLSGYQFKRMLIEDSTTIHLNDKMNKEYPGSKNQMGEEYATLKIQTVYEIIRSNFLRFEVTNFRKNDQSFSPRILDIVRAGDLVLRDLGYFVLGVFKQLTAKGVSYVSRLRQGVNIYTKKEEEEPIDLAKMLKKRGELDMEVFLGEEERLPVRLIALPVEEEVVNQRRRKAKKRRDHGRSFSKRYLYLLAWDLFITNIPKEEICSYQIAKIYSMRWRIETIFKSWKSCLGIKKIPDDSNKIRLKSFIYCMLIFIVLFQVHYYIYFNRFKKKGNEISISLIKLMQYFADNIFSIIFHFHYSQLREQIIYYCSYEKRGDRVNYNQCLCQLS